MYNFCEIGEQPVVPSRAEASVCIGFVGKLARGARHRQLSALNSKISGVSYSQLSSMVACLDAMVLLHQHQPPGGPLQIYHGRPILAHADEHVCFSRQQGQGVTYTVSNPSQHRGVLVGPTDTDTGPVDCTSGIGSIFVWRVTVTAIVGEVAVFPAHESCRWQSHLPRCRLMLLLSQSMTNN